MLSEKILAPCPGCARSKGPQKIYPGDPVATTARSELKA